MVAVIAPRVQAFRQGPQSMQDSESTRALPCFTLIA